MPTQVFIHSLIGGDQFFRCPHCETLWKVVEGKNNEYSKQGEA
jgi:hypothetical protein